MQVLWRTSRFSDLTGEGARRVSGRWHSAGSRVVYMSETASGALLEHLAYLEVGLSSAPSSFPLMRIEAPDGPTLTTIDPAALPPFWRDQPALTRAIGDAWLRTGEHLFLAVPSVLCPATWNRLLNPRHSRAAQVQVVESTAVSLDSRLTKRRGG